MSVETIGTILQNSPNSDDGGSGVSLPSWLPRSEDGFADLVIEFVAEWIVGGILNLISSIGQLIIQIGNDLLSALAQLGVIGRPFVIVAELVLDGVDIYADSLAGVAAASGPLAPLVLALGYASALLIGAALVRAVIELVRFI